MENDRNQFDIACEVAIRNSKANQEINGHNFFKSIKRPEEFSIQEDYIKCDQYDLKKKSNEMQCL